MLTLSLRPQDDAGDQPSDSPRLLSDHPSTRTSHSPDSAHGVEIRSGRTRRRGACPSAAPCLSLRRHAPPGPTYAFRRAVQARRLPPRRHCTRRDACEPSIQPQGLDATARSTSDRRPLRSLRGTPAREAHVPLPRRTRRSDFHQWPARPAHCTTPVPHTTHDWTRAALLIRLNPRFVLSLDFPS